jgi:hypothetical protein
LPGRSCTCWPPSPRTAIRGWRGRGRHRGQTPVSGNCQKMGSDPGLRWRISRAEEVCLWRSLRGSRP